MTNKSRAWCVDHYAVMSNLFLVYFNMATIRGSGSRAKASGQDGPGLTKDRVTEIIHEEFFDD